MKQNPAKIAILVSRFNQDITEALYTGARYVLKHSAYAANIERINVPGAFELPIVAQNILLQSDYLGAVALGAVIRGETPHFDYVCQATAYGIMQVSLATGKPVTFGVITADHYAQAKARASETLQRSADKKNANDMPDQNKNTSCNISNNTSNNTSNKGVEAAEALVAILPEFNR